MNALPVLGIDIAKAKFDVELQFKDKPYRRTFCNQAADFAKLNAWLHQLGAPQVHACLEATGVYGDELALFLHAGGHVVSIVNPAQIKAFGQSELSRTKTDKADAALIARFCHQKRPAAWTPPTPEIRELRARVRRLEDLQQMLNQEQNRLSSGLLSESIASSLQASIAFLKAQIKQLLKQIHAHIQQHPDLARQQALISSIDGLAELTAAKLIAEFQDILGYGGGRPLAAQAGLTPRQHESGSSVRGKPRLSKIGHARIRKALYMPAVVAMRHNPIIREFAEHLRQRGKHTMLIIGAVMRKLLHLVYGVLKSGKPFDPHYLKTGA